MQTAGDEKDSLQALPQSLKRTAPAAFEGKWSSSLPALDRHKRCSPAQTSHLFNGSLRLTIIISSQSFPDRGDISIFEIIRALVTMR
jgi:hypothetical protein